MATEKILSTRIQLKIDTLENWKSSTLKIKNGEVCFATLAASEGTGLTEPVVMMKVGNAEEKTFAELPWAFYAKSSDVLTACKTEDGLTKFVQNVLAGEGIASDEVVQALAGRMDDAEDAIEVLNGNDTVAGSVAKSIKDAIAALDLANTYDAKGAAAQALVDAKAYVDGKDTAMDERVDVLEAAIAAGGVVDTKIENAINALDVTDTAVAGKYVSAVNEVDGKVVITRADLPDYTETYAAKVHGHEIADVNGLSEAIADAKKAGTDANSALEAYKTSNDNALAGVKETADAAAVKTEVESALNGKVDKVEGKSLIADTEIARLLTLHNYDDTALAGRVSTAEGKITALETESAKHALKTELEAVDAKFANYKTAEAQKAIDDAQDARIKAIEDDYLVEADIADFETKENVQKVADDLAAYVESNDEALAEVRGIADAARTEEEVNSQIDAKIEALNLATTYEPIGAETRAKAYADGLIEAADLGQYTTGQEVKDIVDTVIAGAVEGDTITGLANLVEYINTHGGEAAEMGAAVDVLEGKVEVIEGKPAYGITTTQIANWDGEVGAKALAETKTTAAEVKIQIEAYGYATTGYADEKAAAAQSAAEKKAAELDAALKTELEGKISAAQTAAEGHADGLNTAMNARVEALEAIDHEHANHAELDKFVDGDKAKLDSAVQTVTAAADSGLKATRTGNDIAIEIDDSVVFVFDCGNASV